MPNLNSHDIEFINCHYPEEMRQFCFDLMSKGYERERMICNTYGRGYKVDFVHFQNKHIIEIDGPCHKTQIKKDQRQDAQLKREGWTITRVIQSRSHRHKRMYSRGH